MDFLPFLNRSQKRAHAAANTIFNIWVHSAVSAAAGIFGQRVDGPRNLWKIDGSGLF
jgi:hypothetical protein